MLAGYQYYVLTLVMLCRLKRDLFGGKLAPPSAKIGL